MGKRIGRDVPATHILLAWLLGPVADPFVKHIAEQLAVSFAKPGPKHLSERGTQRFAISLAKCCAFGISVDKAECSPERLSHSISELGTEHSSKQCVTECHSNSSTFFLCTLH